MEGYVELTSGEKYFLRHGRKLDEERMKVRVKAVTVPEVDQKRIGRTIMTTF